MSRGSKRKGWKAQRNLYKAISREMAALALAANPPAPYVAPTQQPRSIGPPAQPKPIRPVKAMTEREALIKKWYLYGDADDATPEGLTDSELLDIRRRFCK